MYLYFYEAQMLVGFNPYYPVYPCIEKCKDLNKENDDDDDEENDNGLCFDGWEREENEDGTFYLVYKFGEIKYYLGGDHLEDDMVQLYSKDDILKENHGKKMVFDDEGTTIMYYRENDDNEEKNKLHPVRNQNPACGIYLSNCIWGEDDDEDAFSGKVCLTNNFKHEQLLCVEINVL
jgi:hypothetical protein